MTLFIVLLSIKAIILGAVWGRIDGGGLVKMHEHVERALILFFPVLACTLFAGWWAFLAYAGMVGIATGHGQYFLIRAKKYLGDKSDKQIESYERTNFLLTPFFGQDPRIDDKFAGLSGAALTSALTAAMNEYGMTKLYWRNVCGMLVTGQLFGLPAMCLALWFGEPIAAALFALSGVVKAISYISGYAFFSKGEDAGTVVAEYINGGLRTALCVAAILTVI